MKQYIRKDLELASEGVRSFEILNKMLDDSGAAKLDASIPDWTHFIWTEGKIYFYLGVFGVGHCEVEMR